jgi:ADP-ribose pyrophosphatase YjhB (NUDIX family)
VSREYPDRPFVGIGIVVLRPIADGAGEVLLVRRGKAPNIGSWTLPGGAQDIGETAEAAARRELLEETGVTVGPLHLAANVDAITRDPDGRVRYHYTILDFAGLWLSGVARGDSDAAEARWVAFDDVRGYQLWSEAYRVIEVARGLLGL